jgi:hypothetical protein
MPATGVEMSETQWGPPIVCATGSAATPSGKAAVYKADDPANPADAASLV